MESDFSLSVFLNILGKNNFKVLNLTFMTYMIGTVLVSRNKTSFFPQKSCKLIERQRLKLNSTAEVST